MKGLKLRASYILLAVSIVILAIGIILTTNFLTAFRPPATPLITVVADQTLVVPVGVENAPEICFNVTTSGILKGFVDVISGQRIDYYLYPEPSGPGWTVAKGESVSRSLFEVPLDPGRYKIIIAGHWSDQDDANEDSVVSIYLEFWS
jgi:hypothetical protein